MIPNSKPQLEKRNVVQLLSAFGEQIEANKILMLGIRGYYANTFGVKNANDRKFYDDALFVLLGENLSSYNFNVDPFESRKGLANLVCGIYEVVQHRHKGKYPAFQITKDILRRDETSEIFTGRNGINFHYGSNSHTFSEGCQTLPQSQWNDFQSTTYNFMKTHSLKNFKYILTSFT